MYTYDSFGTTSSTDPTFPNPFHYTGREHDGPTGLYFYRSRYYAPSILRFLSEDPFNLGNVDLLRRENRRLGGEIRLRRQLQPQGLNGYDYVQNNPARFRDPLGWEKEEKCPSTGYVDINFSFGTKWFLGATGGVVLSNRGVFPYIGGGIVTPGPSGAVTGSPFEPTPGWNVGLQGTFILSGQVGVDKNRDLFWEVGFGGPAGAALTGYYIFGPFPYPTGPDCR